MLFQTLIQSPVFRGISLEELQELLESVHYQIKRFKKGDLIAQHSDSCEYLMVIIKGSVMGEMLDAAGKSIKIEDVMAPYPIASAFLFGNNKFPVNVTANNDVEIFYLSRELVVKLFQRNRTFLMNYLNAISNRSQFLARKLMFLNFKSIKGKIANYLINNCKPNSNKVIFPKSQTEMAKFFGVARPSFSRSLKELAQEEVIAIHRREITILNRKKLLQLLN